MSPLNERNQAPFEFQPITTDFLYLRLLGDSVTKYDGKGERMHRYGKLLWKREAALDSWALRIQRHLDEIRSVWTFANNHYEGFSPEDLPAAGRNGWVSNCRSRARKRAAPNERGQLDLFAEIRPVAPNGISSESAPKYGCSFSGIRTSHPPADSSRSMRQKAAARPCPSRSGYGKSDFSPPRP